MLYEQTEPFLTLPQLLLSPLALGDIIVNDQVPVGYYCSLNRHMADRTIFAGGNHFPGRKRSAILVRLHELFPPVGELFTLARILIGLAPPFVNGWNLFKGVAEEFLVLAVDVLDIPVHVGPGNSGRRGIHEGLKLSP